MVVRIKQANKVRNTFKALIKFWLLLTVAHKRVPSIKKKRITFSLVSHH